MKPLGKLIQILYVEGKNWKHELNTILLQQRTTLHATTKVPPCELLFNRKSKGELPQLTRTRVINKHKFAKENINVRNKVTRSTRTKGEQLKK